MFISARRCLLLGPSLFHPIAWSLQLIWVGMDSWTFLFLIPQRAPALPKVPLTQLTASLITMGNSWTRNGLREGCELRTLGSVPTVHLSNWDPRASLFPILRLSLLIWQMGITVFTSLCCGLQKVKQCIAKQFSKCKGQPGDYDSIVIQSPLYPQGVCSKSPSGCLNHR